MATSGKIREKKGAKWETEREREGVSRERESGVDEKRNGGNGVLINWRVIKSRSDTPWFVESIHFKEFVTAKDIGLAGATPRRVDSSRAKEKERRGKIKKRDDRRFFESSVSSPPFPFDDVIPSEGGGEGILKEGESLENPDKGDWKSGLISGKNKDTSRMRVTERKHGAASLPARVTLRA